MEEEPVIRNLEQKFGSFQEMTLNEFAILCLKAQQEVGEARSRELGDLSEYATHMVGSWTILANAVSVTRARREGEL